MYSQSIDVLNPYEALSKGKKAIQNKKQLKMTWSRYSRVAAFIAGTCLAAAPESFSTFIETGKTWFVWQGAFLLSVFWIMLYLSHRWAHKKGEY